LPGNDPCSANVGSWLMTLSPFSGRAISLFRQGAGGAANAALRLDRTLAAPAVLRVGSGKLRLLVNNGTEGLLQHEVTRPANPRTAWQQLR
jgi:hypothetical protein